MVMIKLKEGAEHRMVDVSRGLMDLGGFLPNGLKDGKTDAWVATQHMQHLTRLQTGGMDKTPLTEAQRKVTVTDAEERLRDFSFF